MDNAAAMAGSLCGWRGARPLRGRGCSRVSSIGVGDALVAAASALSGYPQRAEQLGGSGGV